MIDSGISRGGWDIALLGIPLIALLVFGVFRLDEVSTSRKHQSAIPGSPPQGNEPRRKSMQSDPDGRPWDDN